jgi:hypothetical protein
VDQGGQAGGEDDEVELPPLSVERGAALAACGRQPGQPVAAIGTAEENRPLVARQFAATSGENRRTLDQASSLLPATAGGEPSDAAALRQHSAQDRGATRASGIGEPQSGTTFGDEGMQGKEKCRRNPSESGSFETLGFLNNRRKGPAGKTETGTLQAELIGGYSPGRPEGQNGNSS